MEVYRADKSNYYYLYMINRIAMKSKSTVRNNIFRGLAGIIIGLFLLINPQNGLNTIVSILAVIILTGGLFSLYTGLRPNNTGTRRLLLMSGSILIVLGILMLVLPSVFSAMGMILIALLLILTSTLQIAGVFQFRKVYGKSLPWYSYANPLLVLVLAIVIIVNPFKSAVTLTVFTGIFCLVYAVTETVQAIVEYRIIKKSEQNL